MLSLNATASAPDSSSFTYSWDINGTSESGQSVLYYFQNPGNYSVSVTVTDGLGASATIHRDIEVLPQGSNSSIAISYTKTVSGNYGLIGCIQVQPLVCLYEPCLLPPGAQPLHYEIRIVLPSEGSISDDQPAESQNCDEEVAESSKE